MARSFVLDQSRVAASALSHSTIPCLTRRCGVPVRWNFLPQVSVNALGLNGPEDLWVVDLETRELLQIAAIGEDQPDFAMSDDGGHVLVMGAFGIYLVTTDATDPPYAIAPGEFHGGIDWVGGVDDEEWAAIRESVFQIQDSPQ